MRLSRLLLLSLYIIMTAAVYRVTSTWWSQYELESFVQSLHADLFEARMQAIQENRPIDFRIDLQSYGTAEKQAPVPAGILVPPGISLTFLPNGHSTEAVIMIRTPRWKQTIEVTSLGMILVGELEALEGS